MKKPTYNKISTYNAVPVRYESSNVVPVSAGTPVTGRAKAAQAQAKTARHGKTAITCVDDVGRKRSSALAAARARLNRQARAKALERENTGWALMVGYLCEATDLSLRGLARKLDVGANTPHKWTTGKKPGRESAEALTKLARQVLSAEQIKACGVAA